MGQKKSLHGLHIKEFNVAYSCLSIEPHIAGMEGSQAWGTRHFLHPVAIKYLNQIWLLDARQITWTRKIFHSSLVVTHCAPE